MSEVIRIGDSVEFLSFYGSSKWEADFGVDVGRFFNLRFALMRMGSETLYFGEMADVPPDGVFR